MWRALSPRRSPGYAANLHSEAPVREPLCPQKILILIAKENVRFAKVLKRSGGEGRSKSYISAATLMELMSTVDAAPTPCRWDCHLREGHSSKLPP